jgi:acyl-CoA thioester hydrolase
MTAAVDLARPESFPFFVTDTVRFSDVDRYGHVNNVSFAVFCESGRVAFLEKVWPGACSGEGEGWVIVTLNIHFRAQAHYPGEVRTGTRVLKVGRTSCTLGHGLFKDGTCFATAEAVVVWVSLADGRPLPLPEALKAALVEKGGLAAPG